MTYLSRGQIIKQAAPLRTPDLLALPQRRSSLHLPIKLGFLAGNWVFRTQPPPKPTKPPPKPSYVDISRQRGLTALRHRGSPVTVVSVHPIKQNTVTTQPCPRHQLLRQLPAIIICRLLCRLSFALTPCHVAL